ncbi:aspartic protease 5-like [Condylostylus longicornis]|uniref:aspartic protease 5-like n=1 Tax=Condylostylus longicornis TaxID=2530218 RepID=UPI00244DEA69|nr:aspartic protease 5-like [Condylostylus longicornis]
MESSGPRKRLQTASLYGGIYDYAYYFVSVLVGTPPQRQSVIVDSGSSLLGFPCRNCVECGNHMDGGFDFTQSKTAHWLSCRSPQCITGRCGLGDVCPYQQSYSEGSSIEGNYFSDMVALGEQRSNNSFVRFDHIGCHHKETNLFVSQKASGILGVSYPKHGKQETLIDALFKSPDVDTKIFSICAAEEGGLMTIGGFNSTLHIPSRTQGSATLRLLGLSQSLRFDMKLREEVLADRASDDVAEPMSRLNVLLEEHRERRRRLQEQQNNTLGQPPSFLKPPVSVAWTPITSSATYQIEVNEVFAVEESGRVDDEGVQIATSADLGHCIVDSVMFFMIFRGGAVVEWKAHSYLHRRAKTKVWCVAVDDNGRESSILGMSFMKHNNIIFDRERDLIGFVEANCPTVADSSRPPPPTFAPSSPSTLGLPIPDFVTETVSVEEIDVSPGIGSNAIVFWGSAGIFMGVGVLAMGAIAFRTMGRRPLEYEPMNGDSSRIHEEPVAIQIGAPGHDDGQQSYKDVGRHDDAEQGYKDVDSNESQYDDIERELTELEARLNGIEPGTPASSGQPTILNVAPTVPMMADEPLEESWVNLNLASQHRLEPHLVNWEPSQAAKVIQEDLFDPTADDEDEAWMQKTFVCHLLHHRFREVRPSNIIYRSSEATNVLLLPRKPVVGTRARRPISQVESVGDIDTSRSAKRLRVSEAKGVPTQLEPQPEMSPIADSTESSAIQCAMSNSAEAKTYATRRLHNMTSPG